jgi:hypothetical protein
MPKPWTEFACSPPTASSRIGACVKLDLIYHVTHTNAALRILDDGAVGRRLISDESILNKTRTTVVWLSPDWWNDGFRYGNVRFAYDFKDIVEDRNIYWVEVIRYGTPACRFIVSKKNLSHLGVEPYDPSVENGPLRFSGGTWWRNERVTTEIMLDDDLSLTNCRAVDFVQHHHNQCALYDRNCRDKGAHGRGAAARFMAYVLARDLDCVDNAMKTFEPKENLTFAADLGLSTLVLWLGAMSDKLDGPLKSEASADAVLRAALLQIAVGDKTGAKATASLIGSADLLRRRLAKLSFDRFGVETDVLAH